MYFQGLLKGEGGIPVFPTLFFEVPRQVTLPKLRRRSSCPTFFGPPRIADETKPGNETNGSIDYRSSKWVFPKIGIPQNGWFMMENPIKIYDLGVPLFSETSKW